MSDAPGNDASPEDVCARARALIAAALQRQPPEFGQEVDEIERTVARLRDALIERLRREDAAGADTARTRRALDPVNAVLSLVVGVEYPAGGVHRELLEQAGAALEAVPAEALA
ncbi:MAG TPA: hypothetical protein VFW96_01500 [Thermomicrobiales bacterium]|nr:hypothetical protein [Thermomicrobiales bacterium]